MIRSIEINNFRCYKHLLLNDVTRTTLIVGDNGSGKTSLLEAIFLALGSSSEIAVRLRGQRGLEGSFAGSPFQIEEALWGDFFYHYDMEQPIRIEITGDGPENRTLQMSRGSTDTLFSISPGGAVLDTSRTAPIVFQWTDANRAIRQAVPVISSEGFKFPATGEVLPDFFYIGAQQVPAAENAGRFSTMSKRGEHRHFVDTFLKAYDWIEDINLELHSNAPVLFGTLKGSKRKVPLPNISSGINRLLSILLCMAARPRSIVLVDEIETGVFYAHLPAMWQVIHSFAATYECQLIASTHSKECIDALVAVAPNKDDIGLWRTERNDGGHQVIQMTGEDVNFIYEMDEEIR